MTTTLKATFDGKVLVPAGKVDLPRDTVLELRVKAPQLPAALHSSLAKLAARGMWADRTDLPSTSAVARRLRRRVEARKDHAK